ncbi:hypothetical protein PSN45_001970 [Yamadazyma tenuis]|nr:hypothetical protein PSN45_001970 [Yamadazyma tenuis]
MKPSSQQFISLVHCSAGKADYQKTIKVDSITQIDWKKPFCIYKPRLGSYNPDHPHDTVRNLAAKMMPGGLNTSMETQTSASTTGTVFGYLRDKFDKILERVTGNNKIVQYTGERTNRHIQDIEGATLQASMEWESRNLVCYKLARRRKYSKLDLSFYVPSTFVGGLFECGVSPEQKRKMFQEFKMPNTVRSFDVECEPEISRPLMPLIADYSTNQWWDVSKNIFSPSAFQNIPYLTTSDRFDLRFSVYGSPDTSSANWASKIRVNEDYDYSGLDPHLFSEVVASTSDFIFKALKPIDFTTLIKQNEELTNYKIAGKPIAESDLIINALKKLNLDQKMGILLSLQPSKFLEILQRLQNKWDSLFKHDE